MKREAREKWGSLDLSLSAFRNGGVASQKIEETLPPPNTHTHSFLLLGCQTIRDSKPHECSWVEYIQPRQCQAYGNRWGDGYVQGVEYIRLSDMFDLDMCQSSGTRWGARQIRWVGYVRPMTCVTALEPNGNIRRVAYIRPTRVWWILIDLEFLSLRHFHQWFPCVHLNSTMYLWLQ
jgi:hypothetical protein